MKSSPARTRELSRRWKHPNSISVGASIDRTSAALGAGVLEPAIDAAHSAQAANSIEKMLCHQMAGAHFTAMHLLERVANGLLEHADVPRITNAAARMMDVYQAGCLTLLKLKTRASRACGTRTPERFERLASLACIAVLAAPISARASAAGSLGTGDPVERWILRRRWRQTAEQDRKVVADSLLHEMVHYALEVETGDHVQDHGNAFPAPA